MAGVCHRQTPELGVVSGGTARRLYDSGVLAEGPKLDVGKRMASVGLWSGLCLTKIADSNVNRSVFLTEDFSADKKWQERGGILKTLTQRTAVREMSEKGPLL